MNFLLHDLLFPEARAAASPAPAGLRYLSLCSGIEAATVAWHSFGWHPVAFSEIEPFPSAVLAHHWPHVPNLGDMTLWREWSDDMLAQVDILVGGTPCQAFSVAGLRNSLSDERGNLTLTYAHLLDHIDTLRAERGLPPVICVWENVPGVLSTKDNAFGCFLGALAGEESALEPAGTKWSNAGLVRGPQRAIAWRTLDAQYFGVAQRRRRVFVVASARNGFRPEEVLFEFDGVRRDSPPSREARQDPAARAADGVGGGSEWPAGVAPTLNAHFGEKQGLEDQHVNGGCGLFVPHTSHTLRGEGFDASEDGTGRGTPLVPVSFRSEMGGNDGGVYQDGSTCTMTTAPPAVAFKPGQSEAAGGIFVTEEYSPTLQAVNNGSTAVPAVAFAIQDGALRENPSSGPQGKGYQPELAYTLEAREALSKQQCTSSAMQVRRLTPTECERLQGFPDGHTLIPWKKKPADDCPDGPRYKALGNSFAVPVVRWIGLRISQEVARG